MKTIADTIGCDNETVGTYLTYLTQAYMTIVLSQFSKNSGKILRKNKTLYVLDNGVANALLRLPELNDSEAGRVVESVCARNALSICEDHFWSLLYWRDKDNEVDLIIDRKTDVLPIEIKYRKERANHSFDALRKAFPDTKIPTSVVVTKDHLSKKDDVLYIPFWLVK